MERVILKSVHPEAYPNMYVDCYVVPNCLIKAFLESIPEESKFYAHQSAHVMARSGQVGEVVKSTYKTIVNEKEYVLNDVYQVVGKFKGQPDIIVTEVSNPTKSEYVVRADTFLENYEMASEITPENPKCIGWVPKYSSKLITKVDEDIIIVTNRGTYEVCLAGSYIVTNDADTNDYEVIDQNAFEKIYQRDSGISRIQKK